MKPFNLILASQSPTRAGILQKLHIPFKAVRTDSDESALVNESAEALVARLAKLKAFAVSADEETFVIGCDQVACLEGEILGKPHTMERAIEQLSKFSGKTVRFYTGLCLRRGEEVRELVETFDVVFRELSREEIVFYLELEKPLECAGSIKCEGFAIHLFKALHGRDLNTLMGLPVMGLGELFREYGVDLLFQTQSAV